MKPKIDTGAAPLASIGVDIGKEAIALANKLARIAWSVLRNNRAFDTHLEPIGDFRVHGMQRHPRGKARLPL